MTVGIKKFKKMRDTRIRIVINMESRGKEWFMNKRAIENIILPSILLLFIL